MGALDGVSATGPSNLIWIGTGPLTLNGLDVDRSQSACGFVGATGAVASHEGTAPIIEDHGSEAGSPGDSGAGDPAWMPPLTRLPQRAFQYQIELRVDQETGHVVTRVIDRESGEVVRQVPPEYVLQLAMYIDEWLGRILDTRA